MNLKKNEIKKDLVINMIKELAKLQSKSPEIAGTKLDYLLKGFLNDSLDFENAIRYIDANLKKEKDVRMKVFWIIVVKIIQKYFEDSNKLK